MKTFIVKSYNDNIRAHRCEVIDSETNDVQDHYVDLFMDNKLGENVSANDLVGKKFTGTECIYLTIASDLKELL